MRSGWEEVKTEHFTSTRVIMEQVAADPTLDPIHFEPSPTALNHQSPNYMTGGHILNHFLSLLVLNGAIIQSEPVWLNKFEWRKILEFGWEAAYNNFMTNRELLATQLMANVMQEKGLTPTQKNSYAALIHAICDVSMVYAGEFMKYWQDRDKDQLPTANFTAYQQEKKWFMDVALRRLDPNSLARQRTIVRSDQDPILGPIMALLESWSCAPVVHEKDGQRFRPLINNYPQNGEPFIRLSEPFFPQIPIPENRNRELKGIWKNPVHYWQVRFPSQD